MTVGLRPTEKSKLKEGKMKKRFFIFILIFFMLMLNSCSVLTTPTDAETEQMFFGVMAICVAYSWGKFFLYGKVPWIAGSLFLLLA